MKFKIPQKRIYLDDVRFPETTFFKNLNFLCQNNKEWQVLRSFNEFVDYITTNGLKGVEIISFDHDLTWLLYTPQFQKGKIDYEKLKKSGDMTGYHCLEWVIKYCIRSNGKEKLPRCLFHTQNEQGKKNMIRLYETWKDDL